MVLKIVKHRTVMSDDTDSFLDTSRLYYLSPDHVYTLYFYLYLYSVCTLYYCLVRPCFWTGCDDDVLSVHEPPLKLYCDIDSIMTIRA